MRLGSIDRSHTHPKAYLAAIAFHSLTSHPWRLRSRSFAALPSGKADPSGTGPLMKCVESTMVPQELQNAAGGFLWEDPTVFAVNKRSARTTLFNFPTAQRGYQFVSSIGRQTCDSSHSSNKILLNGDWAFKLLPCPTEVPLDFSKGCTDDSWTKVRQDTAKPAHACVSMQTHPLEI